MKVAELADSSIIHAAYCLQHAYKGNEYEVSVPYAAEARLVKQDGRGIIFVEPTERPYGMKVQSREFEPIRDAKKLYRPKTAEKYYGTCQTYTNEGIIGCTVIREVRGTWRCSDIIDASNSAMKEARAKVNVYANLLGQSELADFYKFKNRRMRQG